MICTLVSLLLLATFSSLASELWLPTTKSATTPNIACSDKGTTASIAIDELRNYWCGGAVELRISKREIKNAEGYKINAQDGKITITAASESGLMYGAYELLRRQALGAECSDFELESSPAYDIRVLNHWDNLDGTVERGYAGHSIWEWDNLPAKISPRYREYARANASIGINVSVLNNVNATPQMLSAEYIAKVQAIADELRPYNIRVMLSINFSSPKELGALADSDPLNPDVVKWWRAKTDEIYRAVPDFAGFLVKANSEGLPGPQDYGRTHADGANMLAKALAPHNGVVMWRTFVYNSNGEDRAKQAYTEFTPFDGEFDDNVIIQVKNGPVDFQPREPFTPLFGAMPKSQLAIEFQITQEYLGFSNHLVYLAPLYEELLNTDTFSEGEGSTIAKITTTKVGKKSTTAIAGVSNIGREESWCGHHFAQSNWYCFGRLAWDPALSSEQIAEEWLAQSFEELSASPLAPEILDMMLTSRESCVDYMMPLGLHHIFAWDHHYGPEPWCEVEGAREDWLPRYYHKADSEGLGFDRTSGGSGATQQYFSPLREQFDNIESCPEQYILWFHHVAWDYKLKSGLTFWESLCTHYDRGVKSVREYQKVWDRAEPYVDSERFKHTQSRLRIQMRDAMWWRDACLLYFQEFSKRPIPYHLERPTNDLQELKKIKLDMKHHN